MDGKLLFDALAQYGVIGIMLFVVLYMYYKKDRALEECAREWQKRLDQESAARISDAKAAFEKISELQRDTHMAVSNLATVKDVLLRHHTDDERERERERRDAKQTGPHRPVR